MIKIFENGSKINIVDDKNSDVHDIIDTMIEGDSIERFKRR